MSEILEAEAQVRERLRRVARAIEASTVPLSATTVLSAAPPSGGPRAARKARHPARRALLAGLVVGLLLALALLVPLPPVASRRARPAAGGTGTASSAPTSVNTRLSVSRCRATWPRTSSEVAAPGSAIVPGPNGLVVVSLRRTGPATPPSPDGVSSWTLAGLGPTCALDRSFGTGGIVALTPPGSAGGRLGGIDGLYRSPTGGYVVAGDDPSGWVLARLDAAGRLVEGFGSGGYVVLDETGPPPQVGSPVPTSVVVLASGALLVAGTDGGPHATVEDRVVALAPDGAVVRSFGQAGTLLAGAGSDVPRLVVAKNAFYVVEPTTDTGCSSVSVAGYTLAGSPLPGFSWTADEFGPGHPSLSLAGVAPGDAMTATAFPGADGGFLLAGAAFSNLCDPTGFSSGPGGHQSSFVAAFAASGTSERSFGSGGSVRATGAFLGALALGSPAASRPGAFAIVLASAPASTPSFSTVWSSEPTTVTLQAFTSAGRPLSSAWGSRGEVRVVVGPSELPPVLADAPDGSLVLASFTSGEVTLVRIPAPGVDGRAP